MKSIGHPLVGDKTYGSGKINYPPNIIDAITSLNRQALHALKLSFIHPVTEEQVNFSSQLAPDFKYLLNQLKGNSNYEQYDETSDEDYDADDGWEIIYVKE